MGTNMRCLYDKEHDCHRSFKEDFEDSYCNDCWVFEVMDTKRTFEDELQEE